MKKAIIFGVTGQDGSHLAELLLEKGYKVVGVVRRSSTNKLSRIEHLKKNPLFIEESADLTDYSSIYNLLNRNSATVSEIYNLAAQSHVSVSFKQPGLTWDVTAKGVMNILQAMQDLQLNHVRFYQASSSEMFGKNYDEYADPNSAEAECYAKRVKYQDEKTKFMPQSPYAIAKCAAHEAVRLYRDAYSFHASAGILFNHEGPRRGEDFVTRKITIWIGKFMAWLKRMNLSHNDISLLSASGDLIYASGVQYSFPKLRLGNLEASRDWGYAGDYVEAMWMMLQQDIPDDYVICTGETHTIREFLDVAFNYVGIKDWSGLVVRDPQFYRPAEVDYLKGDCSKANSVLGWRPKYTFEQLVHLMVDSDIKASSK